MVSNRDMTTSELLASAEAEYAGLGQFIVLLKKRLGLVTNGSTPVSAQKVTPAKITDAAVEKHEVIGQEQDLASLSRGQAAIEILKREKRSLSTTEIGNELKRAGVDMSSKTAFVSLNTALIRLKGRDVKKEKKNGRVKWRYIGSGENTESPIRRPVVRRNSSGITLGNVAEGVIRAARHGVHINEIMEAVKAAGLTPSRATLSSGLLKDSKKRFKNEGGNTYTLKEWESPKSAETHS